MQDVLQHGWSPRRAVGKDFGFDRDLAGTGGGIPIEEIFVTTPEGRSFDLADYFTAALKDDDQHPAVHPNAKVEFYSQKNGCAKHIGVMKEQDLLELARLGASVIFPEWLT
jgi:hypothetical protein